jgi:hypothetical protein
MRLLADQFLPANLAPWLWIAGAGVLLLIFYFAPRRRPGSSSPADGESVAQSRGRAVGRELHALTREISQMVQRADRLLDEKSRRLEQLIESADQRIALLRSLEKPSPAAPSHRLLDHMETPPDGEAKSPSDLNHAPADVSSDQEPSPINEADARHAQIYAFHDQGLTARQIADHMLRPAGEIELILALRPPVEAND